MSLKDGEFEANLCQVQKDANFIKPNYVKFEKIPSLKPNAYSSMMSPSSKPNAFPSRMPSSKSNYAKFGAKLGQVQKDANFEALTNHVVL